MLRARACRHEDTGCRVTPADFKAIRIRLGLSQNELGRLVRLSGRTVRRIENEEPWAGKIGNGIDDKLKTAMLELDRRLPDVLKGR